MDFIRPIGPAERDIDPLQRVERAHDEGPPEDRRRQQGKQPPPKPPEVPAEAVPPEQGPVEGDDGHLHVDIRA